MTISLIVAAAENGVIGNKGDMPWRLPTDLARFRKLTTGHPIIMGRKTYESIGHPLAGRQSIVVTHDPNYIAEGCDVVHSLETAIETAKDSDEIFVIGGGVLFKAAMPLADKLYLTQVHASPEGDAFFEYDPAEWQQVSVERHEADDENQYAYTFLTLTRIR